MYPIDYTTTNMFIYSYVLIISRIRVLHNGHIEICFCLNSYAQKLQSAKWPHGMITQSLLKFIQTTHCLDNELCRSCTPINS